MPVTLAQMRKAAWALAFEYDETNPPRMHFRIYTNTTAPKITMAHVHNPNAGKLDVQFRAFGFKCTLAEAVRRHNEEEGKRAGRHQAAGSVQSLRAIKAAGVRR